MKQKRKLKPVPKFRNEDEEREFWWNHDTTDYFDYSKENRVTIEFDPSYEKPVKLISIRVPREMLHKLKAIAIKRDIPYQSLIKMYLADKIKEDSKMVIALMKEHIYKEDNILYPLAEDVLAPGDLEELGKECEKV